MNKDFTGITYTIKYRPTLTTILKRILLGFGILLLILSIGCLIHAVLTSQTVSIRSLSGISVVISTILIVLITDL